MPTAKFIFYLRVGGPRQKIDEKDLLQQTRGAHWHFAFEHQLLQ